MPTDADFDLTDPCSPPPRYNVLHDPHLKEYFQNPAMRRRLVEKGTLLVVSILWSRFRGRRGGVMVSAQDCGPSGPGSSPDQSHQSPSASLHAKVIMSIPAKYWGTSWQNAGEPCDGLASHPGVGRGTTTPQVASFYRDRALNAKSRLPWTSRCKALESIKS